jgi:hypothetical protein
MKAIKKSVKMANYTKVNENFASAIQILDTSTLNYYIIDVLKQLCFKTKAF